MTAAGIVAEYNPFHLGHAFHLARTREALGPDSAAVCVMSGHWVQRGDCAAADKWTRAALALAQPGDTVVLAGKGHETYQEVGGKVLHLDEREEIAAYFQK